VNLPISVLIVDDHPLFRRGIVEAIGDEPTIQVVGEAGNLKEALSLADEHSPKVVVTDVDMPGGDGLELATLLRELNPEIKVVILTMHREESVFNRAFDLGIHAYISKEEVVFQIVEGITHAAEGRYYVPPSLSDLVMRRSSSIAQKRITQNLFGNLTPAESKILRRIARNQTSKEIAAELGIGIRTVGSHRNNIAKKLELVGRMPLVNYALLHRDQILGEE